MPVEAYGRRRYPYPAMPPNVLLIVFDTARADAFEPYGAGEDASPTVAQLARRGAAFRMAISSANWTMPSHASMFAGALPRAIGLGGAPGGRAERCRPVMQGLRERLLPEVLRRAGYATAGVSCNTWISRHTGFDTGFDRFVEPTTKRQARMRGTGKRERVAWALESVRAHADDGADEAERVMRGWIDAGPRQPFFWFVNLIECHSPYMPRRPYNDLSAFQRWKVGEEARRHLNLGELWRACLGGYEVPADAMGRMRHLYGRSVRQMDDWLARVLEALDRKGMLDDTLVIVTSDHGENLGEGKLIGHSFSLDQRLVHVPLVVAGPGAPAPNGIVGLAELPRMIAGAVDLSDHPWTDTHDAPGIAVSQYNPVALRTDPRVQKAIADWGLAEDAIRRLSEPATSVTDGRWKLVRHGHATSAYDLVADPMEVAPIALDVTHALDAAARDAIARLRAVMDETDRRERAQPAEQAPGTGAGPEPTAGEIAELEDRLRELGYL